MATSPTSSPYRSQLLVLPASPLSQKLASPLTSKLPKAPALTAEKIKDFNHSNYLVASIWDGTKSVLVEQKMEANIKNHVLTLETFKPKDSSKSSASAFFLKVQISNINRVGIAPRGAYQLNYANASTCGAVFLSENNGELFLTTINPEEKSLHLEVADWLVYELEDEA